MRTRNIGAGPSSSASVGQAPRAARAASRAAAAFEPRLRLGGEADPDQVREGRVAQRPPALELAGEEAGGVVARRRGRCSAALGRQGLDDHLAPGLAAAAAPGELGDHREGPLLGAEVGEAQGRVGVEDRAQRHLGEVVALGDHLGADEDGARRPRRSAARMRAWAPRAAAVSESRRKTGIGASRSAQQRLDPLGAGAGPRERGRAALGAGARQRLGVGAVVADEAAAVAVDDQRDVAVGAVPVVPAGAAGEPGREAAAVDHHDRLARRRARTPSSASQVSACSGPERGSASRMSTQLDRRHPPAVDPARQLQARQLEPGLRPRRRGAGDEHGAALRGAAAGDGAGVVAGVALLLVGGVVLLVDDDQAEVADRGEDGRARADADARLAAAQAPPLVVALAGGEGRVEDGEAVAEPGAEAGHRLRREADLGDEDDRAAGRAPAPPRPRPGRPRSCPSR